MVGRISIASLRKQLTNTQILDRQHLLRGQETNQKKHVFDNLSPRSEVLNESQRQKSFSKHQQAVVATLQNAPPTQQVF
jgi:hypothetical protein